MNAPPVVPGRRLRVFLCHASQDKAAVRDLYRRLRDDGFDAWLDEERLLPGQEWEYEIRKAVRASDLIIICLSRQSVTKRGFVQKEIRLALDVADEQPEDSIFLIPLKLEDCEVPDRLRKWQWVALNGPRGYDKLIAALDAQVHALGLDAAVPPAADPPRVPTSPGPTTPAAAATLTPPITKAPETTPPASRTRPADELGVENDRRSDGQRPDARRRDSTRLARPPVTSPGTPTLPVRLGIDTANQRAQPRLVTPRPVVDSTRTTATTGRSPTRRSVTAAVVVAMLLATAVTLVVRTSSQTPRRFDHAAQPVTDSPMFRGNAAHTADYGKKSGVAEPKRAWGVTLGATVLFSTPAIDDDTVYVGSESTLVYALDARTGAKRWSFNAGDRVDSSPAVAGATVYAATDGTLDALDARTGAKRWSFKIGNKTSLDSMGMPYDIPSSPVVAGAVVYIGSIDGTLYALDARTGAKRWSVDTGGTSSTPAVADGTVYVSDMGGMLSALDARTGAEQWAFDIGSIPPSSAVAPPTAGLSSSAVAGGMVYVGSIDGTLYALNARTGAKRWSAKTGESILSSPAVAGGMVYVGGADGTLYALNARTGAKRWSAKTGSDLSLPALSSPAVAGGMVYIGSVDGALYALNAQTGARSWRFATGGPIISSPTVVGAIYVGSNDGTLYAIG